MGILCVILNISLFWKVVLVHTFGIFLLAVYAMLLKIFGVGAVADTRPRVAKADSFPVRFNFLTSDT